jgi:hypothetical protein
MPAHAADGLGRRFGLKLPRAGFLWFHYSPQESVRLLELLGSAFLQQRLNSPSQDPFAALFLVELKRSGRGDIQRPGKGQDGLKGRAFLAAFNLA